MVSFPRDLQNSSTRIMFGGTIFATLDEGRLAAFSRSGSSILEGLYSQSSYCQKGPGKSESNIKEKLETAVREKIKESDIKLILLSVDFGFDAYTEGLIVDDTGTFGRIFTNWICKCFGYPKVFHGQILILNHKWNVEIQDIRLPKDSGLHIVIL